MLSKIFKLYENNQYGFAMTKPLPIGIFKKELFVSLNILNKSIKNFNPSAKIGNIFITDIEFDANDDPRIKMYNEVLLCIPRARARSLWIDVALISYSLL